MKASLRSISIVAGALEDERGNVIIFVAILMVALLGMTGLAIDLGRAAAEHRQAQNVADAAAEAAGYQIYAGQSESAATASADQMMTEHGYTASDLTSLQYLDASGSATANAAQVQTVRSVVTRSLSTTLLGIVGIRTMSVTAGAAVGTGAGSGSCVFCVLDPHAASALNLESNGGVSVTGGNIVVDSDSSSATNFSSDGNVTVSGGQNEIVGGYVYQSNGHFNPAPVKVSPVPDPLANVPDPLSAGLCGANKGSASSGTIGPGTYSSIMAGDTNITLAPGIYCITGTLGSQSSGNIVGNGVLLYFTCGTYPPAACSSSGQSGGMIQFQSSGGLGITAPTSGTYQGLSIFYDRHNTAPIDLQSDGGLPFTGTIYARSSKLVFESNGGTAQYNSMIVVGTADMQSDGGVTITYNKAQNYSTASLPVFTQ